MTFYFGARRVSQPEFERFLLGELPARAMARVRAASERDPTLRARLDDLRRSSRDINSAYPADVMAAAIRQRLRRLTTAVPDRTRPSRWFLASTAAVLVGLAAGPNVRGPGAVQPGDRIKGGGPSLVVYRWTESGPQRLAPGSTAESGDVLRIGYRAAGRRFGAILSVDGVGSVTQHLPASGDRAVSLTQLETTWLDEAFELDAAPRWERLYLITDDEVFDLAPLREVTKASARRGTADAPPALNLRPGAGQVVFSIRKQEIR